MCYAQPVVWLFLLFVVLPAVELALLIEIGGRIGTPATITLIILTGMVGASLARWQGLAVIGRMQSELAKGELPAGSLVDGVIILVASALLVTPGVLTDLFGFLCLVPAFRSVAKEIVQRRFERMVEEQRIHVSLHFEDVGSTGPRPPVYDVTPEPDEQPPTMPRRRE